MTTQIFTSVVNRPDFVETQYRLFKTFLKDEDWQFNVVDDSMEESITEEFKSVCDIYGIKYYRKPQNPNKKFDNPLAGARHATETIQWTYDTIIKEKHDEDMVLFCDSDMFLLDEFSIEEYIKDEVIAGSLQVRGPIEYIWNGIMFFNMSEITKIDPDLNFSDGNVEGNMTDIGGHLYYWFLKNNVKFKNVNEGGTTPDDCPEYPEEYNGISLVFGNNDDMWTKPEGGFSFELHLENKFLHYRAGTNWHTQSSWKTKEDPIRKKAEVFNQIIKDFI
jgi:hypothetical protein|tara:strand:+ start:604 stop:1431 length:828 start_codon:yes stop_codon:yes gene_type:complete